MTMPCGCNEFRWRRLVNRRRRLAAAGGLALLGGPPRGGVTARAQVASPVASDGRVLLGDASAARGPIVNGSFVSPLVEIYGDVAVGRRCFVASNTILFAGEGARVSLGDENNCQENAYLLGRAADVVFGDMVSIAHQAVIEDSVVGDFTFFGFRSRTRGCEVGEGAMIMHNTVVEGVAIPPHRITPMGARITTQAEADALPEIAAANEEFKREVQHVNLAFVEGYTALYERLGRAPLEGVGPNPTTAFNPESVAPRIGAGTTLAELVRIVGDVRLGEESSVGQRSAIRADEGTPIAIGRRARIQSRVTFHALAGTSLVVGDNARIGDGNVLHGPLVVGDNFVSEDDCVVFRAVVEDNVTVRAGATVAGDFVLREGTIVPEGAAVATQEDADALPRR